MTEEVEGRDCTEAGSLGKAYFMRFEYEGLLEMGRRVVSSCKV